LKRFAQKARRAVPNVAIAVASGDGLPFAASIFDIVEQSMLFSPILDDSMRVMVAAESAPYKGPDR